MRSVTELKSWTFQRDDRPAEQVEVPHDWAITGPFDRNNDLQITRIFEDGLVNDIEHTGRTGGLPHVGFGRYSCTIPGPDSPERCVYLDFDGVMSRAKVYINGELAGGRNYAYSSFRINAGEFLHAGSNRVEVTAENPPAAARWYPGAGIYRPVRRVEMDPIHFGHWAQIVRYLPDTDELLLTGRVENVTGQETPGTVTLSSPLFEQESWDCVIPPAGYDFERKLKLKEHRKWDVDDPALYPVVFHITSGAYADEETVRYGIRSCVFDPERGFLLNGKRVKLNGVCMHHDLGPIGAAFNRAAAKRQLEILRQMGCNAIRTSHNPPAPGLLDLCDEMGFLVMDEAFDAWRIHKTDNDYATFFDSESETDLSDLIRRDRNHPSIILWSIGNEVREIHTKEAGGDVIARRLCAIVKKFDRERPVTAGLNDCESAIENGIAAELDIPAWNYRPQKYHLFHKLFPHCPVIGAETLSTVSSRGVYYFPASEYRYRFRPDRPEKAELQCSSYCLDVPGWAMTPEAELLAQDMDESVAGQFIWTGFDYLGEPTPYYSEWPARSSYFGCVDLVGLPKDLFYMMKSQWVKDAPMVHIVPHHWNWKAGQKLDIHVFSNCEQVELFITGESCKRRYPTGGSAILAERYRFIWYDLEWQPGEIRAVGYRNGEVCTEEVLKTAGAPAEIRLKTDRCQCAADGEDMLFVEISVVDRENNPVPDARSFIRFSLTGSSLRIAAADGGNPASTEVFHLPECTLFSGKAVVYLRSTGVPGKAVLNAAGEGLAPAQIELTADRD
ncbi:MAG: DUF4982 domain-containing protein [Lentisphaeria bacterium]|nr:DUF4982 domain-containing protein [Lentisphaeria bacterium]